MKRLLITVFAACLFLTSSYGQDKPEPPLVFGYDTRSIDFTLEPADLIVHYKRTQAVLNNQTKENDYLTDTLALVAGRRWSVFYNTTYNSRYASWGKSNVKKTRQSTKPVSLIPVPLASVIDKKNASDNYVEGNFGEPTVVYFDRSDKKIYSVLYAPTNIMNMQNAESFEDWTLNSTRDTVADYACMQAEIIYADREWVAFYTNEIPVPDGPWKFCGLPGLILKVGDKEGDFMYEAIGLEILEGAYITMKDDCETVPLDYFNKVANDIRSIRRGSFLYDGEFIVTESRPYIYFDAESRKD